MVAYTSVQNQYPISRGTKLDYYAGDNIAMITGSTALQLSSDTCIVPKNKTKKSRYLYHQIFRLVNSEVRQPTISHFCNLSTPSRHADGKEYIIIVFSIDSWNASSAS
jgi:hypothetical protein